MGTKKYEYSVGNWVVHSTYGVGQIKDVEKKSLTGELDSKEDCFRVETSDGTFWFSAKENNNSRIRPIASKYHLRREIGILKMPPKWADKDNERLKSSISEVQSDITLASTLFIVRELFALRARKHLGMNDEKILDEYSRRLTEEYALIMNVDKETAWSRLVEMMNKSDQDI